MALALVHGRAVLTVTARELGPVMIERLEVEWPGPRKSLAIAELRHELGDDFPAILVTGDLDPLIQSRAAEQGIRVMHKPLDQAQLLLALHQATTRSG